MIRRLFTWRNLWRLVKYGVPACLVVTVIAVIGFIVAARGAQRDFRPITEPPTPEQAARIAAIPGYQRDEDATYLTFPEWYLVFNPQEYAQHLAKHPPSTFPYFRGIAQMWSGYKEVYGIAQKHYAFNGGYNMMLIVICGSSTAEFGIKGVYEKTVGRAFEWTMSDAGTPEDVFAARVAREYGDFIPRLPWFEFPFWARFKELWSHDFFGPNFLRKCERKFFLSIEYGFKAAYAAIIGAASRSAYGTAATEVHASVHDLSDAAAARPGVRKVQDLGNSRWIITVPHYQGFTETVPLLAQDGVQFEEIAGNDEIMLTLVAPAAWTYDLSVGKPLFTMALLTGSSEKRVAVQVPVKALTAVLRDIEARKLRLEHLYDY